ncbi:MAG: CopG family transcriptional regulator [Chloroflexota bacterium]
MEMQNVTLSLPKETLRQAKIIAIKQNKSLSALLTQTLTDVVIETDRYQTAKERHLAWLEAAPDLGSGGQVTWTREELHER